MIIKLSTTQYLKVWFFFVFATSFVISNTVKGTTPAFIFSILSLPFVYFVSGGNKKREFFRLLIQLIGIYFFLLSLSQIFLSLSNLPNYSDLVLISSEKRLILRSSLFTQSVYIVCSWLTFSFVKTYYKENIHLKYLMWAISLLVIYGFYLWFYYIFIGGNGDFISNREFADGLIMPAQFQQILIGSFPLMRFVSLSMEPSMYVFTILPYYVYLISIEHKKIAFFILISLFLTFSGTFVFGMIIYAIALVTMTRQKRYLIYIVVAIILVTGVYLLVGPARELINNIVVNKLLQESDSGLDRFQSFYKHIVFFFSLPMPLMLFGVGFGFIRSPELLSTLLVNSGIIGFLLFFCLLLYPVYKLNNDCKENIGLKCALILIVFMLITSVSEYSYPSIWVMLGIAYNRLKNQENLDIVNKEKVLEQHS